MNNNRRKPITTHQLGALLGIGHWRIVTALERGYLSVAQRPGPRHYWSDAEIRAACDYFGLPLPDFVRGEQGAAEGVRA